MIDTRRNEGETEEQYLWRLGQAKDNGLLELDWQEIADLINAVFRSDESEYRTEAAYRKPYQQAKRFYDAGIFSDKDEYTEKLRETTQELRKEKQKLSDERTELNRKLRNEARLEADLAHLGKLINENASKKLIPARGLSIQSDNDLIVCVSDFHFGIENNNVFGSYNSDIAAARLGQYVDHIEAVQELHGCKNAYVVFLGDLISGEIHLTTQLENREMLVEQVQEASELLSEFVYRLSICFENVYVNGVAGNHSRISYKDEVLRGNKLDSLIPWYMKAALSHIKNVYFLDKGNYDATIGKIDVRGKEYILVHGDYDQFSESGISKLVMMIGHKPCAILMGHMHHISYDNLCDIHVFRSGSFSGSGDDFAITKRVSGMPSQLLIVVNNNGPVCNYPVVLDRGSDS